LLYSLIIVKFFDVIGILTTLTKFAISNVTTIKFRDRVKARFNSDQRWELFAVNCSEVINLCCKNSCCLKCSIARDSLKRPRHRFKAFKAYNACITEGGIPEAFVFDAADGVVSFAEEQIRFLSREAVNTLANTLCIFAPSHSQTWMSLVGLILRVLSQV